MISYYFLILLDKFRLSMLFFCYLIQVCVMDKITYIIFIQFDLNFVLQDK
jgi:hypothetical protein